jgi:hypothetical protein
VSDPDGARLLDESAEGAVGDADRIGRSIAERLLARGAGALLGR